MRIGNCVERDNVKALPHSGDGKYNLAIAIVSLIIIQSSLRQYKC